MSILLFQDNASSVLASGISDTDTTITVSPGTGVFFSNPGAGQYALGTFEDVSGNIEIVKITSRTIDSMVIVRGQESTTPLSFASGTVFEQRVTAGMLSLFLQKQGGDTMTGTTGMTGVLALGSGGSIQGGEIAGAHIRSEPGDTSNEIFVPIGSPATAAGSVILTAANIVAHLGSGLGLMETGMICFWSGVVGAIPAGYVLCDGSNSTPDMRDKFAVGGGGSLPTSGGSLSTVTDGSGDHSHGGATQAHVLSIGEIPSHTHTVPVDVIGKSNGGQNFNEPNNSGGSTVTSGTAGGGGGHSHGITTSGTHTHDYSLPPYRALYYIMKT